MDDFYDVVVIGAGPAGLSAAIYAARAKYRVLVLEKEKLGGQITITSEIVNYPGIEKTDGTALTERMRRQAEKFGAEFKMAEVIDLDITGDRKRIKTTRGDLEALGIVLALGANPRKLGFDGEQKFQGRGVAYCATCDGEFFTGMDVFVIGGGFAAAEEAVFLTKYAKKVTIIVREEDFTCAKSVADHARNHEKIEVHYETEILEAGGDQKLQYARFIDNKTGNEWRYDAPPGKSFGIFVFAGYVPDTKLVEGKIELDSQGYIITDPNQKTSVDGVYGAGDVCVKNLRQVVTAVADGAVAATSLEHSVSALYEKLGLKRNHEAAMTRRTNPEEESAAPDASGMAVDPDDLSFLSESMKEQLRGIFSKFEKRVMIRARLDHSGLAMEMERFLDDLEGLSDRVVCERTVESEKTVEDEELPMLAICHVDGSETGIRFYAVPGGHELNSFVIGLYNAAGPGQPLEKEEITRIKALRRPVNLKVIVSLSCTMCPATVMAAGRIAAANSSVEAWAYDLSYFPDLKERYQIMSVPCMIINDKDVVFGKKSVNDLLDILDSVL